MHSLLTRSTLAAVLVSCAIVLSSATVMGTVDHLQHDLPRPVAMTCAVFTGDVVYVFGGVTKGDLLDTIYEIDPETGKTKALPYKLPSPRKLASAVWTGDEAYIIGGIGFDAEPMAEIVRFTPGEGVEVVEGAMPYGTKGIPSVWTGEAVHILGNCLSSERGQHDVIRFDPEEGTSEILENALPIPGAGSTAVWTGDRAYIVGGRQNETVLSDRIIEYVPGEGARFMEARLPQGRIGAACAWDGERLYAFGGTIALECGPLECVPVDYLDEIVVYYPDKDTCQLSDDDLPEPMDVRAAVCTSVDPPLGARLLIPGGLTEKGPVDSITEFTSRRSGPEEAEDDVHYLSTDEFLAGAGILLTALALVTLAIWITSPRGERLV